MSEILTVDRYDEITRAAGGVITHGEALMRLHAHDAALRLALAEATRKRDENWKRAENLQERLDQIQSWGIENPGDIMRIADGWRAEVERAERERDEARRIAADLREMRIGDEKRLNAIIAKVTLQRDEERARSERVACRTKNGSPIDYAAWGSLLEQLGELHLRALTAERERDAALSRLGEGAK